MKVATMVYTQVESKADLLVASMAEKRVASMAEKRVEL